MSSESEQEEKQRKLRERKIGLMMGKLSKDFPLMEVLGYKKLDAQTNKLVNEGKSLTFYP